MLSDYYGRTLDATADEMLLLHTWKNYDERNHFEGARSLTILVLLVAFSLLMSHTKNVTRDEAFLSL